MTHFIARAPRQEVVAGRTEAALKLFQAACGRQGQGLNARAHRQSRFHRHGAKKTGERWEKELVAPSALAAGNRAGAYLTLYSALATNFPRAGQVTTYTGLAAVARWWGRACEMGAGDDVTSSTSIVLDRHRCGQHRHPDATRMAHPANLTDIDFLKRSGVWETHGCENVFPGNIGVALPCGRR